MIEELSIVARARMLQINGHAGDPQPDRRPRRSLRKVIKRAACRLGGALVRLGRRLECYDVKLLGETHGLRSAKTQIQ